jgi:hypothetical protein
MTGGDSCKLRKGKSPDGASPSLLTQIRSRRYIATVLAHRLDGANFPLIQLKNQLRTGEAHSVVAKTVNRMDGLLAVGDDFIDD